jgi:hypothetical protein
MKIKSITLEKLWHSFSSGSFNEAYQHALEYIEVHGESAATHMNLYFIYMAQGAVQKAKDII